MANVSVVIPTLNAERRLSRLLSSLRNQTVAPYEILVIDSSSSDATALIAQEAGCIVDVIPRKEFDHGGTRNYAVNQSSGEIVVFLTQDAIPLNEQYLEFLVKPLLLDAKIAATYGRQIAKEDAIPPEKFARLFNYGLKPAIKNKDSVKDIGIKAFFFSNVCSAVRRAEFYEVGGFPEKTVMNEDMVLAAKLILQGYKVAYVPEAAVWHSHNYSIAQQFRRYFDIGASLSMNRWLLEYATAEGEGFRFVKEQLAWLLRHRHYRWIPHALALTVAKYAGYKLGLMENKLPIRLKRKFSMHKHFWV